MSDYKGPNVWLNRIMGIIIGGLITLAVVSIVTVSPIKKENEALTIELDDIQNGAILLLDQAKGQISNKTYSIAVKTLNTLLEKHPGSKEAAEGLTLSQEIEATVKKMDDAWAAAVDKIRTDWQEAYAAELRDKNEAERVQMEATMDANMQKEWDKVMSKVRQDWEKTQI